MRAGHCDVPQPLSGTFANRGVGSERYHILTLQSADLYLPAFVLLDQATRNELRTV